MRGFFQAILTIGVFLGLAGPLAAADVSLGLGAVWQSSPYKGHDDTLLPVPLINIEGERFYLRGLDAGGHLFAGEHQAISLGVSYGGQEFEPDDADDARLKKLDGSDPTLSAYIQYTLKGEYGNAGLKVLHDILGKSQALSAELYYKYPFALGSLHLSPGAGLAWDSQKQLEYYYDVSPREARKSGLDVYRPEAGFSPFLSLEAVWQFNETWSLMAAEKVLFLSDEIKNSPLVDDGQVFSTFIGLRYAL